MYINSIFFERKDAEEFLSELKTIVSTYGVLTRLHLLDLERPFSLIESEKALWLSRKGWRDLAEASIEKGDEGWKIWLPEAEKITNKDHQ